MTDFTKLNPQNPAQTAYGYDAGLRAFMLKVYNYMFFALLISGSVAYLAGTSAAFQTTVAASPLLTYGIILAPLGLVIFLSFRVERIQLQTAQILFWTFSVAMGASLFWIFAAYTDASIFKAFMVTAATFGAMSLYGYTTKRDLTSIGQFLIMGLFGLIIASLVNIFLKSPALDFALSIISVIVFVGLTAYDTQKLKTIYYQTSGNAVAAGKYALMGALNLYMDFINLFLSILRLMGDRR